MNIRHTFVLAVVLALAAGYLMLAPVRPAEEEENPPWFYVADEGDITVLEVTYQGERRAFVRRGTGWYFQDPPDLPVNLDRWGGVVLLASGPRSRRLLAERVEDPSRYGLDPPQGRIRISLAGGPTLTVLLGDLTPDGTGQYVMLEGSPRLFVVDAGWGRVLGELATRPPYPYWYPHWDAEQVTDLLVEAGDAFLLFSRQEEGWVREGPESTPVDPAWWEETVAPLLTGPRRVEVLSGGLEEPARYGLEEPWLTVRIQYRLPQPVGDRTFGEAVYRIGRREGDGYYAAVEDPSPPLLRLDAGWVEGVARLVNRP